MPAERPAAIVWVSSVLTHRVPPRGDPGIGRLNDKHYFIIDNNFAYRFNLASTHHKNRFVAASHSLRALRRRISSARR